MGIDAGLKRLNLLYRLNSFRQRAVNVVLIFKTYSTPQYNRAQMKALRRYQKRTVAVQHDTVADAGVVKCLSTGRR